MTTSYFWAGGTGKFGDKNFWINPAISPNPPNGPPTSSDGAIIGTATQGPGNVTASGSLWFQSGGFLQLLSGSTLNVTGNVNFDGPAGSENVIGGFLNLAGLDLGVSAGSQVAVNVDIGTVTVGGFMGIGEDYYPLPWSLLTYNPKLEGYEVNVSEQQLKAAPQFLTSCSPSPTR